MAPERIIPLQEVSVCVCVYVKLTRPKCRLTVREFMTVTSTSSAPTSLAEPGISMSSSGIQGLGP